MEDIVVRAENITKEYKLYNSEMDRLKEAFNPFRKCYHKKFYALKNVSFEIKKGEKIGIIGSNGAGKSTLLKILTDVLNQTSGTLETKGNVAALLELGAGFNPDYTGMENIKLNATLMGIPHDQFEENAKKIIEFADIGDFINQPVKSYSSGMFVRLAFATQIFSNPDILIVDEALSVGDIRFQQKCYRAMDQLMKDKTVILVTHDTAAVTRFCRRVIWLNHGEKMFDGDTVEGLHKYQEYILHQISDDKSAFGTHDYDDMLDVDEQVERDERKESIKVPDVVQGVYNKGNGEASIYQCGLFNDKYEVTDVLEPGMKVHCIIRCDFKKTAARPIFGLSIRDRLGNEVIGINTETLGVNLGIAKGKVEYDMSFIVPPLNKGEYTVAMAVANGYQDDHVQLCWLDDALVFSIPRREYDIPGLIYINRGKVKEYAVKEN